MSLASSVHGVSGVCSVFCILGVIIWHPYSVHGVTIVSGVHGVTIVSGVHSVHSVSGVHNVHGVAGAYGVSGVHGSLVSVVSLVSMNSLREG